MKSFFSLCVAIGLISSLHAKQLSWTPEEMMHIKNVWDVQLSPDNETVLFVVTSTILTDAQSGYLSTIYRASADGTEEPFPFSAPSCSSYQPRFSPDGQWIAFLSGRDGTRQLYLIRSDGGEATQLTSGEEDVDSFAWSPNSQTIAFVMIDEMETKKKQKSTSPAYEYQQQEYVNRLWLIDIDSPDSAPRALTSDNYCLHGWLSNDDFDWSPDGSTIVFGYSDDMTSDAADYTSSLATVDVATGVVSPWVKQARHESLPRYSPDGQKIAYISSDSPKKYAYNARVAVRSSAGSEFRELAPTWDEGSTEGPGLLGWSLDGKEVLFFEPKGTRYHISLLPADGKPAHDLDTGDLFFNEAVLSRDRSSLGLIMQTTDSPPEAYVTKLDTFAPIRISEVNQSLLDYAHVKTDRVSWNSTDGLAIEGLLTYPKDYIEGVKYPLLVVVHGGPAGAFDESFIGEPYPYPIAAFAHAGFMIFRPNPRGSCGYGKEFRCANYGDWGGKDFEDIMTGVDALIAAGSADAEKMGIMGWSYGGYMTAWAVTQTSRFKAASMGAGITNLLSFSGTSDCPSFVPDYLGDFFDMPKIYEERSPIYHARNVTTPCLIQHGTRDGIVPASQSYEFYHALVRVGKKPTFILYPGLGHSLGEPSMELDAMERNLAWFQHYLMP